MIVTIFQLWNMIGGSFESQSFLHVSCALDWVVILEHWLISATNSYLPHVCVILSHSCAIPVVLLWSTGLWSYSDHLPCEKVNGWALEKTPWNKSTILILYKNQHQHFISKGRISVMIGYSMNETSTTRTFFWSSPFNFLTIKFYNISLQRVVLLIRHLNFPVMI